jgi:hypothetical protein
MNSSALLNKLSYSGKRELLLRNQDANDIIKAMLNAHQQYKNDYDKISDYFFTGDIVTTAQRIYSYLEKNINYSIESETNQRIMSPGAIVSLKQNDCKNYALFAVGILDSLKRKGKINNRSFYRFVSYNLLDTTPHHTFAVVIDNNGNEIWIDPVVKKFNKKKLYQNKVDKMPLYSISGIGKTKAPPKGLKKVVLKVSLAPARGAFLLLLGLNFMGLATKLANAFKTKKDATNEWWSRLGGNTNELLRKTEQGAKKKRILGDNQEAYMGVVPAAAATAAAPILIKLAEFLKSIGINPTEIANAGKKVVADVVRKKIAAKQDIQNETQVEQKAIVQQAVKTLENKSIENKSNNLPLIIAAGIAVVILMKKK